MDISESRREPVDPMETKSKRPFTFIRNKLIAGVAVAIPTVVTIWVLNLAYRFISGISSPFLKAMGIGHIEWLGFFLTLLILFLVGLAATHVIGRKIIATAEELVLKVPVIATIYSAVKQVIESIKKFQGGMTFKRVVYVHYPATGSRLIGFVTGQHEEPATGKCFTSVFIPTAPNPMTGFLLMVDSAEVIESSLTLEQASKMILSAGLVGPDSLEQSNDFATSGLTNSTNSPIDS